MSQEELDAAMGRYAEGDAQAFEVVYDQLAPRLYGYLLRQTRDVARAEDLLQQTFLLLHRNRGSFSPGAPVVPWAFAIARRLSIDQLRRARFEGSSSDGAAGADCATADPQPDALASARQLDGQFRQAFAKLPASQQAAFTMIRQEGLTMAEAAAVLGTTASAVKLRAHRAYEALRQALGEAFDRPRERR